MKYTPKHTRLIAVLVAAISACATVQAQVAPNPAPAPAPADTSAIPNPTAGPNPAAAQEEEAIILSPFEVSATSDTNSYTAETTLAGNRLSTDLRDIGSSVTIVTSQYLLDTGATDNTTLLQSIGGTEVGGINGNYASPGPGTSSSLLTEDTIRPSEDTRIRGLAAADNTHDFFPSDIPWDEYNTDRIDIQRGPNAILFGEGSPAGIINATSRSAEFITLGNLDLRFGSWGSTRESLDYNQVIVPNQVAVRIDLLHDDEKYEQKPAYSKDQRISGALRVEPSFLNQNGNHTIIKANFEAGQVDSDNPRQLPPTDHITPWFTPGSGIYQVGLNGLNSWVPVTPSTPAPSAANGYVSAARPSQMPYFSNGQIFNDNRPLVMT